MFCSRGGCRTSFLQVRHRDAASVIKAFSGLLEQIANLLRHLVLVAGWLILLAGSIGLLVHPHLSPEHLLAPGAGALAILQSLIKPRRRRTANGVTLQDEPPQLKSLAGSPAEKTDAS
jgi:hypothetical protein